MHEKIKQLHNEMREICLYAGISAKRYDSCIRALDKCSDVYKKQLLDFLTDMHNRVYRKLYEIWTYPHITSVMWHNYKSMGIKGLAEQIEFNKYAKLLRGTWNLRPKKEESKGEKHEPKTNQTSVS